MEDEEQAELSEVKIEIDIAEEPPQYWMTSHKVSVKKLCQCVCVG